MPLNRLAFDIVKIGFCSTIVYFFGLYKVIPGESYPLKSTSYEGQYGCLVFGASEYAG